MTVIEALRKGNRVQASYAKGSSFYYMMFQGDLIFHMEQVTSCASREVERFNEESFLKKHGDFTYFIKT